ncbi:MAG: hypothetical protein HDS99_01760 [Bacteroidales bacterium]|nr:hypothetical protein [Bacteroidales bacterium]
MADKLILNAALNRKADFYAPEKCVVEKVVELPETAFKKLLENPLKDQYFIKQYRELMGVEGGMHHCILAIDSNSGDGLLIKSEGSDYARYSQYIPNAKDIVWKHEQSLALDDLKTHMDCCINKWLEQHSKDNNFSISLTDITDIIAESNFADKVVDYVSEKLSNDPRVGNCELTHNTIDVTKRELTETKLYCPLTFCVEPEDDNCDLEEVDSINYVYYDDVINHKIRQELWCDEDEREHGLIAYTDNEHLAQKVYSAFPSVETRDNDLYGVVTIKSYGELDRADLIELIDQVEGQLADGFGEHFEQQKLYLGDDKVFMSFWNSEDDYFIKPESEVFPEQNIKADEKIVEQKLYCPLVFKYDSRDGESVYDVDPVNYARYTKAINEAIHESLSDENEIKYGLNAYTGSEHLAEKIYSIFPSVEKRDGDLYGVFTIRSHEELDQTELADLTSELIGHAADGWGESFEQHPIELGGDKVYISFWNNGDDYFIKPESEVFPEQDMNQTMGGIS